MALALFARGSLAQEEGPTDTEVKATYLVKLAPFIDWPAAALGDPHSPFTICVVGHDPFGALLDQAAAGQRVMDHPLAVRRLTSVSASPPCQIVFLGGSSAQAIRDALRVTREAPVLTVTDDSAARGVVDFVLDHARVRFRIDDAAAAAHGLMIRAQLLNLAVSVAPRQGGR